MEGAQMPRTGIASAYTDKAAKDARPMSALEAHAHKLEQNLGMLIDRVSALQSHLDRLGVPRSKERNVAGGSSIERAVERDAPPLMRIDNAMQMMENMITFPLLEVLERLSTV